MNTWILLGTIAFVVIKFLTEEKRIRENTTKHIPENTEIQRSFYTYNGENLNFTSEEYDHILTKHFSYYNSLSGEDKTEFCYRVNKFIKGKIFNLHMPDPLKEMPVLVSASAIQLTFGLDRYLLPNFYFIQIFPQEFVRVEPVLCFLEGNVNGHTINLSWKHFLSGIQHPSNGINVGLHEMAHALYYQTFITERNFDKDFKKGFHDFTIYGNRVYDAEQELDPGLYSEYAMTDFQEFWAESIELFFEKPKAMLALYPQMYATMADLLNQDPAAAYGIA